MAEVIETTELTNLPILEIGITVTHEKGKPVIQLVKKISDKKKIRLLIELINTNEFLPAKILVKNKDLFISRLKKEKII